MRTFTRQELWDVMDEEFHGHGAAVKRGSDHLYTGTHEAKGIAVNAITKLQGRHRWSIMTDQTFQRLFGTIAAGGFLVALISAALYFLELPVLDPTSVAWLVFYGVISAGVAVFCLVTRAIWNTRY